MPKCKKILISLICKTLKNICYDMALKKPAAEYPHQSSGWFVMVSLK